MPVDTVQCQNLSIKFGKSRLPMPGMILTLPILSGKVEAWRRFCQELSGSRLQMYISSRRRMGITYERLALVETTYGALSVATLEAPNVARVISQIITSILPFDRWYRERIEELHGIDMTAYEQFSQPKPLQDNQELLFEWSLDGK
jgi:hypothetical protein